MTWRCRRSGLRGILALALLAAWVGGCTRETGPAIQATVQQVIDGDTVVLDDGRKVRYVGIDTPELGKIDHPPEFLAEAARGENSRLTLHQPVRLEFDAERYDQYGRTLAYVFLADGRLVNAELVRAGLARVYIIPPNVKYQQLLVEEQRQALAARRGLWEKPLASQESYYLGNSRTFRFHRPSCPAIKGMSPGNQVKFAHPREAYERGYSPCRNCRP